MGSEIRRPEFEPQPLSFVFFLIYLAFVSKLIVFL